MASRAEWKKHVAAWKKSGRTAKAFAVERGLNAATLRWWASSLRREAPTGRRGAGFARLVAQAAGEDGARASSTVDVVLASGRIVRVRSGFEPALLQAVVAALEGA